MRKLRGLLVVVIMFMMMFAYGKQAFANDIGKEEEALLETIFDTDVENIDFTQKIEIHNFSGENIAKYYDSKYGYVIVMTSPEVYILEYSTSDEESFIEYAIRFLEDSYGEINDFEIYKDINNLYYIRVNENEYIYSITTSDIKKYKFEDVKNFNVEEVVAGWTEPTGVITKPSSYEFGYYPKTVKNVPNYNITYFTTKDFKGENIVEHCSPTAATNLMKYWYTRNNAKYNSLKYALSWKETFLELHEAMQTSSTGTSVFNLTPAYHTYMWYKCNISLSQNQLFRNATISKMKKEIKDGYPFHLNIYNHNEYGNHSFLAVGYVSFYYTSTNVERTYIRVVDGRSKKANRFVYVDENNTNRDIVIIRPR